MDIQLKNDVYSEITVVLFYKSSEIRLLGVNKHLIAKAKASIPKRIVLLPLKFIS